MRSSLLASLLLLGCGVPDPVAVAVAPAAEWVRGYDGVVPGLDHPDAVAVLVRDGMTGEPLPGVTVRLHDENVPTDTGGWAPRRTRVSQ